MIDNSETVDKVEVPEVESHPPWLSGVVCDWIGTWAVGVVTPSCARSWAEEKGSEVPEVAVDDL